MVSSKKKHVPERTCVACRQTKPKREFVRLVHGASGDVEPDRGGKGSGRGAYLCESRECWEVVFGKDKKNRLAHALRTNISVENRAILFEYGQELPSGQMAAERGIG